MQLIIYQLDLNKPFWREREMKRKEEKEREGKGREGKRREGREGAGMEGREEDTPHDVTLFPECCN